jgi:molecular chaperone DnaK
MAKIIGIDLGTTNSVVAVMEGGDPTVISTAEGGRLCPSVVAFTSNGERLVGQTAKRQAVVNSENTLYSLKRFIGRRFDETEVERQMVSFDVVEGPTDDVRIKVPATGKEYAPQEISAMVLAKLRNDAINEPTAAALAYGLDKKENETILVFDLGGGTFDVSLLEVGDGVVEVKATNGDTHLGGDDWDQRILMWIADEFKKEQGIDLREDRQALQRLREAAEKAKIELSTVTETEINLPFVTADASGPKHLQMKLTRATFEQLSEDLVDRIKGPFDAVLKDANVSTDKVDEVVLVGGATRMPMVQNLVRGLTDKDPHKGVNPDEVVAVGAAIQAGVLAGEVKDVLLLDVTPLSLGVETLGGVMTTLIERNTTIPIEKSEVFSTAEDSQTAVDIHVLQGERPMAADNMTLGRFRLEGIPPAPRGIPQIEVIFDIDANGIINVTAKDKATGKSQKVTITASTNLDKNDVERMVDEAQSHAADDRKRRDLAEARNTGDTMAYSAEKALRELGDKVPDADREQIEAKVADLRKALDGGDVDEIKRLTEEVQQASYALSQQLYAQEAPPEGASESDGGGEEEGDVVEGEFREA